MTAQELTPAQAEALVRGHLADVRKCAAKAREWTDARDRHIVVLRSCGVSLRAIGAAAGLSHTAVAKIVAR